MSLISERACPVKLPSCCRRALFLGAGVRDSSVKRELEVSGGSKVAWGLSCLRLWTSCLSLFIRSRKAAFSFLSSLITALSAGGVGVGVAIGPSRETPCTASAKLTLSVVGWPPGVDRDLDLDRPAPGRERERDLEGFLGSLEGGSFGWVELSCAIRRSQSRFRMTYGVLYLAVHVLSAVRWEPPHRVHLGEHWCSRSGFRTPQPLQILLSG